MELPPREAQVLIRRFVEQRTPETFAALWGLPQPTADLLIWRAARSFEAALGDRALGPLPSALEEQQRAADAFRAAPSPGAVALEQHGEALRAALVEAEAAAERSPARRRENTLRLIGVIVVLALAGYFYVKDKQTRHPPEPRTPASR